MWTMVLICGFGMAIDPVRIGLAVVMMSRQRPFRMLMAFWLGGIAAGAGIGLAALVLMRDLTSGALRFLNDVFTNVRAATVIFSGGRLQIAFGLLALVLLAVMTARSRTAARLTVGGGDGVTLTEQRPRNIFHRMGARTQQILDSDRVWPAFLVGMSSSFPPYEGWVVVAIILGSGTAVGTQFAAFMLFVLMLLAVIEIPLVCYLTVPAKTQAVMDRIHLWMQTYRLQITQAVVGFVGFMLLYQGIAAL